MSNRVCKYLRWVAVWNPSPLLAKCHTKHVHVQCQELCNAVRYSCGFCGFWRWTVTRMLEEGCGWAVVKGEGWLCAAASATDLVPEGVTFKPISCYALKGKRQVWPEVGAAEANQTQLWWTIAMCLSGYETSAPHREGGVGEEGLCFPWGSERAAAGTRLQRHRRSAVRRGGGLSAVGRLSKWCHSPKYHITQAVWSRYGLGTAVELESKTTERS